MNEQEKSKQQKLLLTIEETAHMLSLSRTLVYALVGRNEIMSVKIGRSRRVPLRSLQTFIDQQMTEQGGH